MHSTHRSNGGQERDWRRWESNPRPQHLEIHQIRRLPLFPRAGVEAFGLRQCSRFSLAPTESPSSELATPGLHKKGFGYSPFMRRVLVMAPGLLDHAARRSEKLTLLLATVMLSRVRPVPRLRRQLVLQCHVETMASPKRLESGECGTRTRHLQNAILTLSQMS